MLTFTDKGPDTFEMKGTVHLTSSQLRKAGLLFGAEAKLPKLKEWQRFTVEGKLGLSFEAVLGYEVWLGGKIAQSWDPHRGKPRAGVFIEIKKKK